MMYYIRKTLLISVLSTLLLSQLLNAYTLQAKGLGPKEKSNAKELIKKYFASKTDNLRLDILKQLSKFNRPSKTDLDELAKFCFKLTKNGPKHDGKTKTKLNHPDYPGIYYIRVPRSANTKKTPLLIGLHGGGKGVGDGKNIPSIYRGAHKAFEWISAFPTTLKKVNSAWNKKEQEKYVMELIEELKRTYNVDTNRIYLTGHSMGGYGTWSIGGHYADVFAAINPNSGGLFSYRSRRGGKINVQKGILLNLKNTPVYCYHADKDPVVGPKTDRRATELLKELGKKYGPYEFVYDEIKAKHHHAPKHAKSILKWLYEKKRNPYPKHILWEPFRSYKKYFYWLKLDNPKKGQRLEAKIKGNTINIESNTGGLTVFLHEKLVDLTKPVTINVNGAKQFSGLVKPSLVALVETIHAKKDPEMYFTVGIRID